MALYGVALGAVDATTNMQAVALEHLYDRPILPSFHGAWTLGGFVGAGGGAGHGPHADRGDGGPGRAAAGRGVRPVPAPGRAVGAGRGRVKVPWRPIVLVGLAMVLFYMVDTAAFTWGPQYLDQVFPTPSHLVALAVFPYLLASGVIRWSGDNLVARYGAVRVLRVGTVIASVGLAVTVFAPVWPVAVVGFSITGGGVAVVAPLSFSAAARIAGGFEGETDPVAAARAGRRRDRSVQPVQLRRALLGAVMIGLVGRRATCGSASRSRWCWCSGSCRWRGPSPRSGGHGPRSSSGRSDG